MAFVAVLLLAWALSGVLSYFITEAVVLRCDRRVWNRATREFTLVCSLLLGPLYLLISAELLLFALIEEGLAEDRSRHYKDS